MQYITTEEVEKVLFRIIESPSLVKDIRDILKRSSGDELEEYKRGFVEYNFKIINIKPLEIHETNPQTIGDIEVCDDEYNPRYDDSDKSDELRERQEYIPDRE